MMEAGTQLVNCVLKFGDSDGKTIGETHPTLVPALQDLAVDRQRNPVFSPDGSHSTYSNPDPSDWEGQQLLSGLPCPLLF